MRKPESADLNFSCKSICNLWAALFPIARRPVCFPQRFPHIFWAAKRDTNALGLPRKSSQYFSSFGLILYLIGIPVSHSPQFSASLKPGNLGVQSLSCPESIFLGIGNIFPTSNECVPCNNSRRSPTV